MTPSVQLINIISMRLKRERNEQQGFGLAAFPRQLTQYREPARFLGAVSLYIDTLRDR